jgi:hypothetical protein
VSPTFSCSTQARQTCSPRHETLQVRYSSPPSRNNLVFDSSTRALLASIRCGYRSRFFQNPFDVNLHTSVICRSSRRILAAYLLLVSLCGSNPSFPHGTLVVFFGVGIKDALPAACMHTVRCLTKMLVSFFGDIFSANIAYLSPAGACHFDATVRFDKPCRAFGTRSDFRFRNGFFHFEATLVFFLLFCDFFASKWYVRFLLALPAGMKKTR